MASGLKVWLHFRKLSASVAAFIRIYFAVRECELPATTPAAPAHRPTRASASSRARARPAGLLSRLSGCPTRMVRPTRHGGDTIPMGLRTDCRTPASPALDPTRRDDELGSR